MSTETIARRYSAALADVVLETGEADNVKAELAAWGEMFAESADLHNVFSNPTVLHSAKEKLLEDLIDRLLEKPPFDQLQLQRLKKRKLGLKDQIIKLESRLIPDIIA